MGKKNASKSTPSNISSAAAPATSALTKNTNKSSILRSSFAPSRFQLSLFASVIQGLDSQIIRLHETNTGRLQSEHAIGSRASVTCLDWGYYRPGERSPEEQPSKKKRKRSDHPNGPSKDQSNAVLAFGTTDSEICLFSPSESKVLGVLKGGHTQGIRDFKFVHDMDSSGGWSLGGDGTLVQWDLRQGTSIRKISIPEMNAMTLLPIKSAVLCASHSVYLINQDPPGETTTYPASITAIHTILSLPPGASMASSAFLVGAESERFINVFTTGSTQLIGSLVAESDVESLTSYLSDMTQPSHPAGISDKEILAAVTKDGTVELFPSPYDFEQANPKSDISSLKAKRKKMTRKSVASIKVVRPDKSASSVPILGASFDGDDIIVAWVEGGLHLIFERLRWRGGQSGSLVWSGIKEIVKSKSTAMTATLTNGVNDISQTRVDESRTVVVKGGNREDTVMEMDGPTVIDISSSEEESESETESTPEPKQLLTNGETTADIEMRDASSEVNEELEKEEVEEPSFGDLIRANAPDTIDIAAAFKEPKDQIMAPFPAKSVQLPSGMSLGTVLTQALRTNDVNLLETCLHIRDLNIVRATIERLNSSLAASLLQKLAERLHSRPGRAGSLMVWVQWTLVAHGGYLASQPDVVKRLNALYQVVKERASSLQPLLSLKGKLDMLEAQMNLRKSMQRRAGLDSRRGEEDEEAVIYVEGQEDSSSEDESDDEAGQRSAPKSAKTKKALPDLDINGDIKDNSDDSDDMPNAIEGPISENELSEDDSEALIDDEASETDEDSGDEVSDENIDYDDVDSINEDEDHDDEPVVRELPLPTKLTNGVKKNMASTQKGKERRVE
ncbi:MAG: Small subunit (SSU) processome component [Icmadophila ericetorum]|nr:Small subunit (SSU) processome component [Icmadophila ericetorum]